ncbi:MAG: hypothetical protein JW973_06370 [Bacteroidales bacterium]|nr:hypothetical protein [Bacteroidales bacterium]
MITTGFTIEFCGTYLHVHLAAGYEISPEGMHELWTELASASKTHNCRNVLAEGFMPSRRMNMAGAYISGEQIAQSIVGLSLACYFKGYKADELTDFFKTVARNRGTMVEFFSDREEAFRWLGIRSANGQTADQPGNGVPQFLM